MQDYIPVSITGKVKIVDQVTGEVLVDQHNDVLYGNMATALAYALIGNGDSFLYYMGFGNGGAYVSPTGTIVYKPTLGGAGSLIKNPNANLYNTIYVKKLSNAATPTAQYDTSSEAYVATDNPATNYEDIIVDVVLGYSEPPVGITTGTEITQTTLDNSPFIGTASTVTNPTTFDPGTLVFNEIALFAGSSNVFSGSNTVTISDVDNFVATTPDFSNTPSTVSKIMLTHVIFHPVQKSANRSLEIIYTLRIQMGAITS
jgi:hypothetical protein